MTIGIDIDDTITDTYETLTKDIANYYRKSFNEIYDKKYHYSDLENDPYFNEYVNYTHHSLEKVSLLVNLKKDAKEIINKLHQEGHKIVIITARDSKYYFDAYQLSHEYLTKNNILFDKLIAGSSDKGKTALEERIDLFIDDSLYNCQTIDKVGVNVLQFKTYFAKNMNNIKVINSWLEIYDYIQDLLRK